MSQFGNYKNALLNEANKKPFVIKVNLVTLVRWVRKILKWRRQHIINSGKDVL